MNALLLMARALHYLMSWGIAGSLGFLLFIAASSNAPCRKILLRPILRIARSSTLGLLLSGVLWLWVEIASMNDVSLREALRMEFIGPVISETQFGHVWMIRGALLIALAGSLAIAGYPRWTLRACSAAWLLAITLLAMISGVGHAAASSSRWLLYCDALHLTATAFWPGMLLPFLVFLWKLRQMPDYLSHLPGITRRFSRTSLLVVSVLGFSGTANACALLAHISALWATHYGMILLFKLALFLAMLVFAAINLFYATPRTAAVQHPEDRLFILLWRNVAAEVTLGATVALVVALLGITSPNP